MSVSFASHFSASPHTLGLECRDYPEWHKEREYYGVWVIDADTPAVRALVAKARNHLTGLLAHSDRQAHITLYVCGFIEPTRRFNDDFTPAMLAAQCRALESLDIGPFDLHLGGLNSFDSAVFLTVDDPANRLDTLRRALSQAGSPEIRQAAYVAHLTVGLYCGTFDKRSVSQRLTTFSAGPPIALRVNSLQFVRYRAAQLSGPLELCASHGLTGSYTAFCDNPGTSLDR